VVYLRRDGKRLGTVDDLIQKRFDVPRG
jgi:hypothetical protein